MTTQNLGEEGFYWFFGLVEDVKDPLKLGRVKVRVFHDHDENVDTAQLPWAQVVLPSTSGSSQGAGDTPSLYVGTQVFGFYVDGREKQLPMIMGSIPIIPNMEEDRHSISWLARGKQTIEKKPTGPEPKSPYAAQYPYNRVIQTRAGHVIELDDTPENERVHIYHKVGSYIEINKEGRVVIKSTDDNYEIVAKDKHLYVKGDVNIQVTGNLNAVVKGNIDMMAEGNIDMSASGTMNLSGAGGVTVTSGTGISLSSPGGVSVTQGGLTSLGSLSSGTGVTGSFTTPSGKTVHITKGIVANIT